MITRATDLSGDWTFGRGRANYLRGSAAVAETVRRRLFSFLGDCFFDLQAGIDWWNLLGSQSQAALLYSIRAVILGTEGVDSVTEVSVVRDEARSLRLNYSLRTSLGGTVTERDLGAPTEPYLGVSKFTSDLSFTGQLFQDVDVSGRVNDATLAVWTVYEAADDFAPVLGAAQPINKTTVRVTISPVRTGTFRLVGIS